MTVETLGRDTVLTHEVEDCDELVRNDESQNRCSAAVSGHRRWSPITAHQFMLHSDTNHFARSLDVL